MMVKSVKTLMSNRKLIWSMSLSDFKNRYSGSYFGLVWAVVQPMMTIVTFWVVFQVGFRAQPINNVPFLLWLCAAMIPWNFFADAILNSTCSFTSYSFVVKKIVFRIELLPLIKVISSFFLNIAFNIILFLIFLMYGRFVGIQIINIIYYNICLVMFIIAISYVISTLNVFFRDTTQIVGICLQFGIWLTPIMWMESVVPPEYQWVIKINPIYYITNGYRQALLNDTWFFKYQLQTLYFWTVTIVIFGIGIFFYKKMKPHFADVL